MWWWWWWWRWLNLCCLLQSRLEAKLQLQFIGDPTLALICQNEIESGDRIFTNAQGKTFAAELVLEKEVKV